MPTFSASNLVKAQTKVISRFSQNEQRQRSNPALTMALRNSNILTPGSAQDLRKREDRPVEFYIMKRNKRAAGNARTHNHTGNRGDSVAIGVTWQTYSDTHSISLKQMDNNIFSFEEALAQGFYDCIANIKRDIETDNIDFLTAQRTQINNATAGGTFNAVDHVWEVAQQDQRQFFQIGKSVMGENDYKGMYDVIVSPRMAIDAGWYLHQGTGNDNNTAFQFTDLNIAPSADLSDPDYLGGISLWMPAGGFAVLPWIPKQNRSGHGDYNTVLGGYGTISDGDISQQGADPSILTYAVHGYTERADTSASNGNSQDDLMQFEVSVDIARVLSPLSTANESVVYEMAQLV